MPRAAPPLGPVSEVDGRGMGDGANYLPLDPNEDISKSLYG